MEQKPVFIRSEKGKHSKTKGKINVYIDAQLTYQLLEYVASDKARMREFDKRINYLVQGIANSEIYKKENFKDDIDVWAIRIMGGKKGGKLNDRMYCKQYEVNGIKHIIIGYIYEGKKTNHLTEELRNIISIVNNYEYKIEE